MNTFYIKEIIEAGVDESGRGPLFGRVYAAAVILKLLYCSYQIAPNR